MDDDKNAKRWRKDDLQNEDIVRRRRMKDGGRE